MPNETFTTNAKQKEKNKVNMNKCATRDVRLRSMCNGKRLDEVQRVDEPRCQLAYDGGCADAAA